LKTATTLLSFLVMLLMSESTPETPTKTENFTSNEYQDLADLFKDWRTFENPPLLDGAPDYIM